MNFTMDDLDRPSTSDGESGSDSGLYEACPLPRDPCYRCQKRVYPVERVDIGVLFHKRCFRCRLCGLQLTIRTFYWNQGGETDVYCGVHAPKLVGKIDGEAIGIKSALNAPKRAGQPNEQIRGSLYNPGWQYDANALEFSHFRELYERGKQKRTLGTYEDFENSGIFDAQSELEVKQTEEEDRLYRQIMEEREKRIRKLENELKSEREKSVDDLTKTFERIAPREGTSRQITLSEKLERLVEHFEREKNERIRKMLDRISSEEKTRVAKLIEKHSQEMLLMIAEKIMASEEKKSEDSPDTPSDVCVDLTKPPPVSPPEVKKSQLYSDPGVFKKADRHVYEVIQRDHSTFTALVKDLIRTCDTDLEKARVIFRWITSTDLNTIDIDAVVPIESPLGLLRGIKYGTESYHDLFKRLSSYAGLFCEIIQGYSKGAGYTPGMKIDGDRFRNSWTAVCVDGSWRYVNCNWGARHVRGHVRDPMTDSFSYKCDEFYFVTDPEDHIYQHFPDDAKWQLLDCPITLPEFINLPIVKSPFFNYGLHFSCYYDCIQQTKNGKVIIQLKIPDTIGFGYTLDSKRSSLDSKSLEGCIMLRIIGHKAIFTVAPPKRGRYYFTIFAKDDWNADILQSACAFQIRCYEKEKLSKRPFPAVCFFGPTRPMSTYGIIPLTHIDPWVTCSREDTLFQFQLDREIQVSYTFEYYGSELSNLTFVDLQRYVFVKYRDQEILSYQVRCPLKGMYSFSIYRNYTNLEDRGTQECMFRYLVDCKEPAIDRRPLPRACHRWNGCSLLEPYFGDLETSTRTIFRIRAPTVVDVALMMGDIWFHFKESDKIWEGSIVTGDKPAIAKVYAKLDKERSKFSPLLEFQIR